VQGRGELLALLRVGDERAVDRDHEVGGPPVAEYLPLPQLVTAGDHVEERADIAAADGQAQRGHPGRQPVRAGQQDLAVRTEIDHRAQPEGGQPFGVGVREAAERVPAEHLPPGHIEVAQAAVTSDVAHVDRPVQCHRAAAKASHCGARQR
jgi:hypothetical protein